MAPSWRGEEGEEEGEEEGGEDPEGTRKKKTPDSDEDASSEEVAGRERFSAVKGRLEAAEATAAAAIAAAEALGDADALRASASPPCAAEQRFELAAVAAKANAGRAAGPEASALSRQTSLSIGDQNQNGALGRVLSSTAAGSCSRRVCTATRSAWARAPAPP